MPAIEADLAELTGLDRYETITWWPAQNEAGENGLLVTGRAKPYAPPFMMLGVQPREHHVGRLPHHRHGALPGVRRPHLGLRAAESTARWGRIPPSGASSTSRSARPPFFVAPYAGAFTSTFNVIDDDELVAQYDQAFSRVGANLGVNLGARSDLRVGAFIGRLNADVAIGDPGFPSVSGAETGGGSRLALRRSGQPDRAVGRQPGHRPAVPCLRRPRRHGRGSALRHVVADAAVGDGQPVLERRASAIACSPTAGLGTSFDDQPLPPSQFALGSFARLGAYRQGELLGNHYYVGSGGVPAPAGPAPGLRGRAGLRRRLARERRRVRRWRDANWRTNLSAGVIMDTLVGPMVVAGSAGFDGRWRTYVGVGRIFR